MKKTFDSFAPCLELREVIFLRTLPTHIHLVPALDIFLDPYSRKLHICMEYMDGNLYQLMKARDNKCMDSKSVKSILYQILSGLDHIHAHQLFSARSLSWSRRHRLLPHILSRLPISAWQEKLPPKCHIQHMSRQDCI